MPDDKVADAVEALRQAMLDEGESPDTVEAKLHAVKPNETNIVGNFADLQRLGASQAGESGGIADAFVMPPGPADDTGVAAATDVDLDSMTKDELRAEADARGIETSAAMTKAELVAALGG